MKPLSLKTYTVIFFLIPGILMTVLGFIEAFTGETRSLTLMACLMLAYIVGIKLYIHFRRLDVKDEMYRKHFTKAVALAFSLSMPLLFCLDVIEMKDGIRFHCLFPIGIMMILMCVFFLIFESEKQ